MYIAIAVVINATMVNKILLTEKSDGTKTVLIATPLFNARKIFTPATMHARITTNAIAILIDQNALVLDTLLFMFLL